MNTCAVTHDLNTYMKSAKADERRQDEIERLSAEIAFAYDATDVAEIIIKHVDEMKYDSPLVQMLAQFDRGIGREARDEAIVYLKVIVSDLIDSAATAEAEQRLDGAA